MALRHSGLLLVRSPRLPFSSLLDKSSGVRVDGHALAPLFRSRIGAVAFDASVPAPHWLVATPNRRTEAHPWDLAHAAARRADYSIYVEPDLLHATYSPAPVTALKETKANWPPWGAVNPAWHLQTGFTGFVDVRGRATGTGIRIGHLDTGYWPDHVSTPRHVRPDLGYNFSEDNPNTIDPGTTSGFMPFPGHGTATIAILACARVDIIYQGQEFSGDFGGAPDAEVIPVRISPSVVHFYTKAMAEALDYVLGPTGLPGVVDPANRCDVVTISHGGVPLACWADAINHLYDVGVVVVAASGDNFGVGHLPTRFTVYPSAFNRVVTAVGATYDRTPYVTDKAFEMEGNWGPDPVMKKAIAAFTPNVARMKFPTEAEFEMDFGGTSAATPQVAAACALWLALYGARFPAAWQRVEACRLALFKGASTGNGSPSYLGRGVLDVITMLDPGLADAIEQEIGNGDVAPSAQDSASWTTVFRLLCGGAPAGSEQEAMYDTELAGLIYRTTNRELLSYANVLASGGTPTVKEQARMRWLLSEEPDVSETLAVALRG